MQCPVTTAAVAVAGTTASARLQQENLFWALIQESTDPGDFEVSARSGQTTPYSWGPNHRPEPGGL